jgi:hypothetical protein
MIVTGFIVSSRSQPNRARTEPTERRLHRANVLVGARDNVCAASTRYKVILECDPLLAG